MSIVEFVGLPGSGKSRIAGLAAAELRRRGLAVDEPVARIHQRSRITRSLLKTRLALDEALRSPAITRELSLALVRSGQPASSLPSNVLNVLFQRALSRRARPPGLHLFDQGTLQAIWSLALEAERPLFEPWLYEALCLDHGARLVVFLDADAACVLQRLSPRRRPGRFFEAARVDRRFAERSTELVQRLWELASMLRERHSRLELVRIDNRASNPEPALAATLEAVLGFRERVSG